MKKIAKLSLVAAVAVAGFTTANAQPLEEAIKNVDVSGSVVYRYNDWSNDSKIPTAYETLKDGSKKQYKDQSDNNYKVGLNLSSKVNEDVKFNSRFLVADMANAANFAPLDSSTSGDANVTTQLSQANFAYTGLKNTTVTAGKQGLATPYTTAVMIDENEQNGTGVMALSTVGPVTLGAAYFNQTNLNSSGELKTNFDGSENIAALAAIATFAPVTVDAWYLDLQDKFDTYTLGAKSDLDLSGVKLGVDARWASLTPKASLAKTLGKDDANTIAKLALTAKAGIVNGKLAYATTDKDGGITGLDSDASTVLKGWNLNTLGKADADYWQAVAGVDILSNLNLSANYGNLQYVDSKADMEEEEVYGQLTYKMSKNLSTYVRYGTYTKENTTTHAESIDSTGGRVQVAYTF
jgi:hypothetical protein